MFYSSNGNLIENFELHSNEFKSTQNEIMIEECNKLKSELGTLFQKYNDSIESKTQAELNLENIKRQLISAQKEIDLTIANINKSAEEYNKVLMKLHNLNCSSN